MDTEDRPMTTGDPNNHSGASPTGQGQNAPTGARVRRSKRGLFTLSVAVLALIVAFVSAALSWRALDQANDARDIANAGKGGVPVVAASGQVVGASTTEPSVVGTPTGDVPTEAPAEGEAPVLNAQTQYGGKYADQSMTIPAGCNDYVYIDLDEPRVGVDPGDADVQYFDPCGNDPATLGLSDQVRGSEAPTATVTPIECADRIRTSPLGQGKQPVRTGRVFCIMTSLGAAKSRGDTWKMVVLSIVATGQDGTVSVKASAWNIPA
jgi:hypothetical protein